MLCQATELWVVVVVVGSWLGQTSHPWLCTSHCQCVNGVEREQSAQSPWPGALQLPWLVTASSCLVGWKL